MQRGFDMAYSQDAILGHSFAAVYEWVIGSRKIPVVPLFVNAYLPPLPSPQRCMALGKALAEIIESRPEKVAIIASGGLSHYPGTWKYPQPAYDFDYWAIAQMERGNFEPLEKLSSEQLDEVGNTEMLPWYFLFGALGNTPGQLLTYQPTWHHGHAVMRFVPNKRTAPATGEIPPEYIFKQGGFEFYKAPKTSAYNLNKVMFDLRHSQNMRLAFLKEPKVIAAQYGLNPEETKALELITGRKHRRSAVAEAASSGGCRRAPAGDADVSGGGAGGGSAGESGSGAGLALPVPLVGQDATARNNRTNRAERSGLTAVIDNDDLLPRSRIPPFLMASRLSDQSEPMAL